MDPCASTAMLKLAHGGREHAQTARVDWALLLRRTFDVDVSRCARCDGPVRVRAVVTDSASVKKLLA